MMVMESKALIKLGLMAILAFPTAASGKPKCFARTKVTYEYKSGSKMKRDSVVWDEILSVLRHGNDCSKLESEAKKTYQSLTPRERNDASWARHRHHFQAWFCGHELAKKHRKKVGGRRFRVVKSTLQLLKLNTRKAKLDVVKTVALGQLGILPSTHANVPWRPKKGPKVSAWMTCAKCAGSSERIGLTCYETAKPKCAEGFEWHFDSGWKCRKVTYRSPECKSRPVFYSYIDEDNRACFYKRRAVSK